MKNSLNNFNIIFVNLKKFKFKLDKAILYSNINKIFFRLTNENITEIKVILKIYLNNKKMFLIKFQKKNFYSFKKD